MYEGKEITDGSAAPLRLSELRAMAEAATPIWGQIRNGSYLSPQLAFQRAASPDTILELLDRLECAERLLVTEKAEAVTGTLDACREHMACACEGIEGHLAERGLLFSAEAATSASSSKERA